jgi:long-chain acyl-CoA synthetase
METDGFFYFSVRQKRMIKSSGFNVYPTQVESVLHQHPLVAEACVVGVPDASQVERVKAYVVLKDASQATAATQQALIEHCQRNLIKWSCPREIEFKQALPKTRLGKVDYKVLVQEHVMNPRTPEPAQ